jgi:two-component system, OmpR family, response regulator AdeR
MDNALILIAEDDADIAQILAAYLDRDGFRTVCAGDGEVALMHHHTLRPDLVLLDVQMPRRDGFDVLAEIRRRGNTPVIMATARMEDLDKLSALRMGADDYVVKPFNPLEVVARVRAVLRRVHGIEATDGRICWGPLQIDPAGFAAYMDTENAKVPLDLTLTEFRVLTHLTRQPNRVFSRAELLDACLPEGEALERTVDSHVSKLRRKLEAAGAPGLCCGVRGIGYRLAPL